MLIDLPTTGSVLLTGYDQSFQSIIARQIAADTLIDGGSVVFLTDTAGEGQSAATALQARLRASGADLNALARYTFVDNVRLYLNADELKAKIDERSPRTRKALLLVRDLGSSMMEMMPGDAWLSEADELAVLADCGVLTASHHSTAPRPAPDVSRYMADQLWVCQASINLQLTLHCRKPSERTIQLKGRVLPFGVIDFEHTEPQE